MQGYVLRRAFYGKRLGNYIAGHIPGDLREDGRAPQRRLKQNINRIIKGSSNDSYTIET